MINDKCVRALQSLVITFYTPRTIQYNTIQYNTIQYNTIPVHNNLFQHDLSNHSTSADVVICYDVDILLSITSKFYADSHREKNQWISAGPYEKTKSDTDTGCRLE